MPTMAAEWYTNSARTRVTWNTAVVSGAATLDIYRLVVDDAGGETFRLWARSGQQIPASTVTQAKAIESGDAVPAAVPASRANKAPDSSLASTQTSVRTDRASAAVTASGNSGTITDSTGPALSGVVNVTAATGTTPTLDLTLQTSFDGGTTWQDVWSPPRITGTGAVLVPPMLLAGARRWAWTVGGTSPSFTFSIAVTRSSQSPGLLRSATDRAINPNSAGSAAGTLYVEGCDRFSLLVVSGAGASTPPVFGVQVSTDGSNWADTGISLTAAAASTVAAAVAGFPARYARAYVKTAGVGAAYTSATLTAKG